MDIEKYIKNKKLAIYVKANANKNKIKGWDTYRKALVVTIKAPAQDNKANLEIIKFFSDTTGKKVRIKKGFKNKKKILLFD